MNAVILLVAVDVAIEALVALLSFHLYRTDRAPYLRTWAIAWAIGAVTYALNVVDALRPSSSIAITLVAIGTMVMLLMVVVGARTMIGQSLSWGWLIPAAGAGAVFIALAASGQRLDASAIPVTTWLAAVLLATGVQFLRIGRRRGASSPVIGWCFILLGVHIAGYPFVAPDPLWREWGFAVTVVLKTGFGGGLLAFHFQKVHGALTASEARYRSIFEGAAWGIFRCTPDGEIVEANPSMRRLVGPSDSEGGIGVRLSDLFAGDEATGILLTELVRDGKPTPLEIGVASAQGGERLLQIRGNHVSSPSGELLFFDGLVQDITAARSVEKRLQQAQRMEATGRLAGGIAHDFNNLLTVILGHVGLLRPTVGVANQLSLDNIETASKRAAQLVQRLLGFARRQPQSLAIVDLNLALSSMTGLMAPVLGEDVTLELALDHRPLHVRVDLGQLQQVVLNLVFNARDAMAHGGCLTIRTRVDGEDSGVIEVSDTGTGMPGDVQARAFEPFFTTKRDRGGTGLGLASAYGIIEQSGGTIELASEEGHGTCVTIRLPLFLSTDEDRTTEGAVTAPPEASSAPGNVPPAVANDVVARPLSARKVSHDVTVLLVEDEAALLPLFEQLLCSAGFRVLTAQNGVDALTVAERHGGRIDLLVTDIVMPGMRGTQLVVELRRARPDLPVIYMSGYDVEGATDGHSLLSGAPVLFKPFPSHRLVQVVTDVLAGG